MAAIGHTHKRQAHKSYFVCFQLGNSEIIINLTILHTDRNIDILAPRSRSLFIVVEMKAQIFEKNEMSTFNPDVDLCPGRRCLWVCVRVLV